MKTTKIISIMPCNAYVFFSPVLKHNIDHKHLGTDQDGRLILEIAYEETQRSTIVSMLTEMRDKVISENEQLKALMDFVQWIREEREREKAYEAKKYKQKEHSAEN